MRHPPLPMPLQFMLTDPVMRKINKLAEGGHEGAKKLAGYFVGQGMGMMNDSVSARTVVYEFMEDFLNASERLKSLTEL